MYVSIKQFLACAILLTIGQATATDYDAFCHLVKNGVRLASDTDCASYYVCANNKATQQTCPATQAFDKNAQVCRPKSDVQCYFDNDDPCAGQNEKFVPQVGTCNAYLWCINGKASGGGTCPIGMVFRNGECRYGNCNDNINEGESNTLVSICDIMPDGVFFGSTKNCETWCHCVDGVFDSGTCPVGFVFDVQYDVCNYKSGNMCDGRETGQEIIPDPIKPEPCSPNELNQKKPDPNKCSEYRQCDGVNWAPVSCGKGMYYSTDSKNCQPRKQAMPDPACNRCEFSKNQFVNTVDASCRGYLICSNGGKVGEGSCGFNSYFDEGTQACILDADGKNKYAETNGACAPGSFDCSRECAKLDKDDCEAINDNCMCALGGDDKCKQCTGDVDENTNKCSDDDCPTQCDALSKDDCEPIDADCVCALDDTDKCIQCTGDVDGATNRCLEDDCPTQCDALGKDACEAIDTDCICALDESDPTECIECTGTINTSANICDCCETYTDKATCDADANPDCNCYYDDVAEACTECDGTVTAGDCDS